MKRVFSVSLGEETISKVEEILESGPFRNKSHVVEEAILQLFKRGGKDE
ncbi:MAG: ribbon-helix-helix domain-containing protein [Nanoarchaeota archaeon]|nr:ribbon-helix-helix domain-containing protein [Nanoarchaeota archaeon]